MLKNTERYEEQSKSHFTYDEYRRKMKKRPNKDITIFISVFIIGVLILLGFAKVLSPNVDVGITDNENYPSYSEEENSKQASIDERLKKLQMEDTNEMFSPELDEKVVIPLGKLKKASSKDYLVEKDTSANHADDSMHISETKNSNEASKEQKGTTESKESKQVAHTTTQSPQPSAPAQIVPAKVVIGSYSTEKQAEVAKSILQDSGIGVTPIVKNIGGTYTLQVGSYSSREKAQQASSNLIKNNYPARVVVE